MHPMPPAIAAAMIDARLADSARSTRSPGTVRKTPGIAASPRIRARRVAVRRSAGWFLVNLGLHLALPRRASAGSVTSITR